MRAGCHQTRRPLTICFFIIATLLGNYGVFLCSLLIVKRYVGYTSGGCGRVNMSGTATIFRAVGLFFFFSMPDVVCSERMALNSLSLFFYKYNTVTCVCGIKLAISSHSPCQNLFISLHASEL